MNVFYALFQYKVGLCFLKAYLHKTQIIFSLLSPDYMHIGFWKRAAIWTCRYSHANFQIHGLKGLGKLIFSVCCWQLEEWQNPDAFNKAFLDWKRRNVFLI